MPEYLAPGVYVEETSFRSKSIEGVSTSTAGFVGPTRTGPTSGVPEIVTSFGEFERSFGGLDPLTFDDEEATPNYLAQGVRAFFENGGRRLYISRVYEPGASGDGRASETISSATGAIGLTARFPGAVSLQITFSLRVGGNILALDPTTGARRLRGVGAFDLVYITDGGAPIGNAAGFFWIERLTGITDPAGPRWRVFDNDTGAGTAENDITTSAEVRLVSLAVEVGWVGSDGRVARRELWDGLGTHPEHRQSLMRVFGATLMSRLQELTVPIVMDVGGLNAAEVAQVLMAQGPQASPPVVSPPLGGFDPVLFTVSLNDGSDGARPEAGAYAGSDIEPAAKTGLSAFEDLADISIVAAPGYSAGGQESDGARDRMMAIALSLIGHCERMRYRIAVLDSANGQGIGEIRAVRAQLDSSYAALYYPWVRVMDASSGDELLLPPSGFVAGIYARNDVERGVHKAPANEVVRGAIGLELMLNKAQQDVLNPEGINALRWFEGRGYRVWGARTISSDPEWKYVNLRRYFAYLERSIDRGTQWAVFEPNGEMLWANVRRTVEDFVYNEWSSGRLLGEKPEQAYFVRCDRSTMTQNDLDNGRLICLIGVAPLRPAEFVIFRIGQWTADRRA